MEISQPVAPVFSEATLAHRVIVKRGDTLWKRRRQIWATATAGANCWL